jgi:hypothetical protein
MMIISFEIPDEIAELVAAAGVDIAQAANELFFVDLHRKEQINHHQLAQALGLNRYETDGVLKRHGVGIELSLEEFHAQIDSLRELRRQ